MLFSRLLKSMIPLILVLGITSPSWSQMSYENHERFLNVLTKDLVRLMPRSMAAYIFQNRQGYMRGTTAMTRDIQYNPLKLKDLEEIRREAYERLSRDIPYCIEAFRGGEIKLDTSSDNLAGRLGMIAYSVMLLKMPTLPDVEFLESFSRTFYQAIGDNIISVWLFYDGYGDFHSLGELMERLKPEGMPEFLHARNQEYPTKYQADKFAALRSPDKFLTRFLFTDLDLNNMYNAMVNDILDVYVFIWKCSGMDLAHPSYAAPPGTIIKRSTRRKETKAGLFARLGPPPVETGGSKGEGQPGAPDQASSPPAAAPESPPAAQSPPGRPAE
jgi:hypothetical protein